MHEIASGDHIDETACRLARRFFVRMAKQDRKFIAANARDDIALANAADQQPGDLDQCFITGQMAKAVVDELQSVEVDEQKRRFLLVASDPVDQPFERAHESAAVRKFNETVLMR